MAAPRSTSSGTITIGFVAIPVKLYTATSAKGISFNQLHACPDGTHSKLKQRLLCEAENVEIDRKEIVKGYEVVRDQFAIFSEEELKALEASRPSVLELVEFPPANSLDPLFVEKSVFAGPDKGAALSFQLFVRELRDRKRIGIGTFASRTGKDVLVVVRPHGDALLIHELFYADEVRSLAELDVGAAIDLGARERRLMGSLISKMSARAFEHGKYRDTWAEKVVAIAKKKLEGGDVVIPEPPVTRQASELLDALERSIAANGPRKVASRRGSRAA